MNNLVIQTSFLGDCILSLPFLYELSTRSTRLDVIASPIGAELFKESAMASENKLHIHAFDKRGHHKGPFALWKYSQNFTHVDNVFCLQRSFRSVLLARLTGASNIVGFSTGSPAFLYTESIPREWRGETHDIEKNLILLRKFFSTSIPEWRRRKDIPSLLKKSNEKYSSPTVSVALGSPWPTKQWPLENQIQLIHSLTQEGISIKLIGDTKAAPLAEAIQSDCKSLLIENLTGQTNLRQLIDVISMSQLLVSSDSAPVHIAGDVNTPVIALFGPTIPEFGFAPWRVGSKVLSVSLDCRPCDWHGPRKCPLKHHRCMKDLTARDVLKQCLAVLG